MATTNHISKIELKHRVGIERICPYKKINGEWVSPSTLTIMTSHTNKCQVSVFNLTKKNESSEEKLVTFVLLSKIVSKQIDLISIL